MPRTEQEPAAWIPFPPGVRDSNFWMLQFRKKHFTCWLWFCPQQCLTVVWRPTEHKWLCWSKFSKYPVQELTPEPSDMPGAERAFVATSILVPFYWENIIQVNMDLCSAINNLEPDLSLTSFPSSLLMWWQTLGVGRLHLLLASGAAWYAHLHQRAPGSCCADLGSISFGGTVPHCACWGVAVAMKMVSGGVGFWPNRFSGLRFITFNFTIHKVGGRWKLGLLLSFRETLKERLLTFVCGLSWNQNQFYMGNLHFSVAFTFKWE